MSCAWKVQVSVLPSAKPPDAVCSVCRPVQPILPCSSKWAQPRMPDRGDEDVKNSAVYACCCSGQEGAACMLAAGIHT